MKLERLFLDFNEQTDEALKHIYTTLISNKKIEISIDLPLHRLKHDSDSQDSSVAEGEEDHLNLLSPRNAVAPNTEIKIVAIN
jgi:hypothetical protein